MNYTYIYHVILVFLVMFGTHAEIVYDVIIIGSGPAGLTAATYAARAKLNALIIEGNPGGTLMSVEKIQNWPCFESISGFELMQHMLKQAKKAGAHFISDIVSTVDFDHTPFTIGTVSGKHLQARSIIIATGMTPKKLGCPGETEYWQKGVCNCALCDAPLFNKQTVIVAGSGMMALQNTKFLTKYAKKIIIINPLPALTAPENMIKDAEQSPLVTIYNNCRITRILGDNEKVTAVDIINEHNQQQTLEAHGIFVSLGYEPNTELFKDKLILDSNGKIETSPLGHTNKNGVFCAGSAGTIPHEQAIICAASGCIAAIEAGNFIGRTPPKNLTYRCQKEKILDKTNTAIL